MRTWRILAQEIVVILLLLKAYPIWRTDPVYSQVYVAGCMSIYDARVRIVCA